MSNWLTGPGYDAWKTTDPRAEEAEKEHIHQSYLEALEKRYRKTLEGHRDEIMKHLQSDEQVQCHFCEFELQDIERELYDAGLDQQKIYCEVFGLGYEPQFKTITENDIPF